ncbi:hypothetical protein Asi03nite_62680 [Actinoplanes siamensis]|uniref:IPT/TIG domain-containing protein n=1 Tax=Actinoplanes siamensis TaxID=1223317 RepID=A0A919NDQ8_9ACTN|nr:hypothetical protein Asi03nite_62680 [Actinoplanes siamensis]
MGASASAFRLLQIGAKIGGVSAPVAWVDETHLKVTAPATTRATTVTMQLFRKGAAGPESSSVVAYTPGVMTVSPAKVSSVGGATVTVTGTGFLGVEPADPGAVTFGDAAATSVTVLSATKLTAVTPPGADGTAAVRVRTGGGVSDVTKGSQVTYRAALGIDTTAGPTVKAGGGPLLLTITGGTVGATAKEFSAERITVTADRKSLSAAWVDQSHVKVTMPAVTTETSRIVVTHDGIAGEPGEVAIAPVVLSLSARSDTVAGGAKVTVRIAGPDAATATGFSFGDNAAECTRQSSGTTIAFTCVAPAAAQAGPVAVGFITGSGKASHYTAAAIFSYTDN